MGRNIKSSFTLNLGMKSFKDFRSFRLYIYVLQQVALNGDMVQKAAIVLQQWCVNMTKLLITCKNINLLTNDIIQKYMRKLMIIYQQHLSGVNYFVPFFWMSGMINNIDLFVTFVKSFVDIQNPVAGAVETVLWGVVGRDPAMEWVVDAFKDVIVPILKCAKSSSFVKSQSSR